MAITLRACSQTKLIVFVLLIAINTIKQFESSPIEQQTPVEYETCPQNEESSSNYCLNGGVCYRVSEKSKQSKAAMINDLKNDVFCSCTMEYTGERCEIFLGNDGSKIIFNEIDQIILANEIMKKLSLNTNITLKQSRIINSDNSLEMKRDLSERVLCQPGCDLDCQFGYKMDLKNECYKCDCLELNITECGVPCFVPGTIGCLNSIRAHSRPQCVCASNYDGVYCEIYNRNFNFSVKTVEPINLNKSIIDEFKTNLPKEISQLFDIGKSNVQVFEVKNGVKDHIVYIKFGVFAPDFSESVYFDSLEENITQSLNQQNVSLTISNHSFKLVPFKLTLENI